MLLRFPLKIGSRKSPNTTNFTSWNLTVTAFPQLSTYMIPVGIFFMGGIGRSTYGTIFDNINKNNIEINFLFIHFNRCKQITRLYQ